jgi:hypothetical protein
MINLIEVVADSLGNLLDEVVFVGGASVVFLVPPLAHSDIRQTDDVDIIVDILTRQEYHKFCRKLQALGFREDTNGPICRYREPRSNIKVDVMPLDASVLVFTNIWYRKAINQAETYQLPSGKKVRYCPASYFLGCKFEAFKSRNNRDYLGRDFEDICFILEHVDNIERVIYDLKDEELKAYLKSEFEGLLRDVNMLNVFVGVLSDPSNVDKVLGKMRFIAESREQ